MQLQALQVGLTLLAGTTSRTSTRNLRRGLLETFLFDSIIQDFILQVLSIGPTLEVGYKVPTRNKKIAWQCCTSRINAWCWFCWVFSAMENYLLQVLSSQSCAIQELHYNRAVRPKELEWVQCALHKVLLLLHHVVLEATVGPASKVSLIYLYWNTRWSVRTFVDVIVVLHSDGSFCLCLFWVLFF